MNSLIASLPPKNHRSFLAKLESVSLKLGQVLQQPWEETKHVYFPNDSLVSVIAVADGRNSLEVGLIGSKGMVGVSVSLGASKSPVRALVQGAGTAMRMSAKEFRAELKRNKPLQERTSRYANVAMATAMQVAVCNNTHVLTARLARWLLMTSDCLSTHTFFQTQDFLGMMLGVRRTGVSGAAAILQERRLIAYRRGNIAILDRGGLQEAACSCYETIKKLDVH